MIWLMRETLSIIILYTNVTFTVATKSSKPQVSPKPAPANWLNPRHYFLNLKNNR